MTSALKASPEELAATAASLDTNAGILQGMITHLVSLVGEAASSWKGSASSTYQDVQTRLNELLQLSRNTLSEISERLSSSSKEYAHQEAASAQNLAMNFGDDEFHDGRDAQHVVKEAGDKTTVDCDPGKNCPDDLEKKLDQQQQKLDEQQKQIDDMKNHQTHEKDHNWFKDMADGGIAGAGVGAAGGALGGLAVGGVGAIPGAVGGAFAGMVTGVAGALIKDAVD